MPNFLPCESTYAFINLGLWHEQIPNDKTLVCHPRITAVMVPQEHVYETDETKWNLNSDCKRWIVTDYCFVADCHYD